MKTPTLLAALSLLPLSLSAQPASPLSFSKDTVLVRSITDGEILLHNGSDNALTIDSLSVRITSGTPGNGIAFTTRVQGPGGGGDKFHLIGLSPDGSNRLGAGRGSFEGIAIPARSSLRIAAIWYGTCVYCLRIPGGVPYDHEVSVTFHATAAKASDSFKLIGDYEDQSGLYVTPDSVTVGTGFSSSITVHNATIAKVPIDSVSIRVLKGKVGDNFGFTTGTGPGLKYYVVEVRPVTSDSLAGGSWNFRLDTVAVGPMGELKLSQLRYGTCFFCLGSGAGMPGDYKIRVTLHSKKLGLSDSFVMTGSFESGAARIVRLAQARGKAGTYFRADGRREARTGAQLRFEGITRR